MSPSLRVDDLTGDQEVVEVMKLGTNKKGMVRERTMNKMSTKVLTMQVESKVVCV